MPTCFDTQANPLTDPMFVGSFDGSGYFQTLEYVPGSNKIYFLESASNTLNSYLVHTSALPNFSTYRKVAYDFDGDGATELLFYNSNTFTWQLGNYSYNPVGNIRNLSFTQIASTSGFSTLSNGLVIPGNFKGDLSCTLFVWLGVVNASHILTRSGSTYTFVSTGTLDLSNCQTWVGRFTQTAKDEILVFHTSTQVWRLITVNSNNTITVTNLGNFSATLNPSGLPIYQGDFTPGDSLEELIVFKGSDYTLWLVKVVSGAITIAPAGAGINFLATTGNRAIAPGKFQGDGKSSLIYYAGNNRNQTHIGTMNTANRVNWQYSGDSIVGDWGAKRLLTGNFTSLSKASIISYGSDSNWYEFSLNQLQQVQANFLIRC